MKTEIFPRHIAPMLSTMSDGGVPIGMDFVHELKLDGYRLTARLDRGRVDFYTRNGHCWTEKFPAIGSEILRLDVSQCWLDGELVVMLPDGRSCFGSLQKALAKKEQAVMAFYVFDLMYLDRDLCAETLLTRKSLLADLLHGNSPRLQYVDYYLGDGPAFFEAVCEQQLEGIVSKRADSIYRPGTRFRSWVKSKFKGYRQNNAWRWWHERDSATIA